MMAGCSLSFYKKLEESAVRENLIFKVSDIKAVSPGIDLKIKTNGNQLSIEDEDGLWNVSDRGLIFGGRVIMDNVPVLFTEEGIADPNTTLNLAIIISSKSSDRREASVISTLDVKTSMIDTDFEINFIRGLYRDNATIRFVISVKEPSESDLKRGLISGMILGDLHTSELKFGKNNPLFPVFEVEYPGEPLWWVRCDWFNIEDDSFSSDNVAVIINTKHSKYPLIKDDADNKKFIPVLLAEVMSSAMQVIIEKVRDNPDDWEKINSDSTFADGTIAFMIQYMRITLGWDFTTPESLAKSIRKYVYDKLEV